MTHQPASNPAVTRLSATGVVRLPGWRGSAMLLPTVLRVRNGLALLPAVLITKLLGLLPGLVISLLVPLAAHAHGDAHHRRAHVFLLQNSGWMEPFFVDPASPYRALIAEVVAASTEPNDVMLLAAFNQSLPGAPSPKALLSTTVKFDKALARQEVQQALQQLTLAHKPGSSALADTDLNEALTSAIGRGLGGEPGLIWLFTNNKNSPNNDQATASRNREFYQLIHRGDQISAALAFPLKMPLTGKRYQANGMMVYVFAVGHEGAEQLQTLLARNKLQQVLTEPAARLKPLDLDTVRLLPQKVLNTPGVNFSLTPGGVLQANVAPDAKQPQATIAWEVQNRMYPYTIASATLSATSSIGGENRPVQLSSQQITQLTPQTGQPLQSNLQLPLAKLPGAWSWQALRAAGSAYVLPGQIKLQLGEQKLLLSEPFRQRMAALFPGDPLPDIFTPPVEIKQSQAVLPLQVRVEYGIAPLLAALMLGGLLAAAGLTGYWQLRRMRKLVYSVDGRPGSVQGSIGRSYALRDWQGEKVAMVRFGWLGPRLLEVKDGVVVKLG